MPNKRHIMIDAITRIIERMSKKSEEQMDVEIDICTFTHLSKVFAPQRAIGKLGYVSSGYAEQLEKENCLDSGKILIGVCS